jgi:NAD(P)-dependent dehydrogenase (short-subunit alcohol dehydrogenase family)
MQIAVTGSSKLAGAIIKEFEATPIRIEQDVDKNKFDVFINCAHVGFQQTVLLEDWFHAWSHDYSKLIINISSRAGLPNLSKGYMYAAQKASLEHMADNLMYNCAEKNCRMTTLCLGMLEETDSSLSYAEVCDMLFYLMSVPEHLEIPKVYLQHADNYLEVQQEKARRYGQT